MVRVHCPTEKDTCHRPLILPVGYVCARRKYRWVSSIARDKKYNILLGYNISSSDMYPSIAVTGRTLQDPLGTMEGEVIVVNGTVPRPRTPASGADLAA